MYLYIYLLTMISRICMISFVYAFFLPNMYPRIRLEAPANTAGDPLILTPYLMEDVSTALALSEVSLTENMGFKSYAGFLIVDPVYESHLYFWYFPAFSNNINAPVVIWLQGGPGCSSLYGLFTEIGPIDATNSGFKPRRYHWALNNHLIFIDNPVGTGFSFTKNSGYCDDQECIAKHLYEFLHQFFILFPHLSSNHLYITGESYAGKYIPSFGYEIHLRNKYSKHKINLKGMAIGNGYCDPINQINYGEYLYQLGLIDSKGRELFKKIEYEIQAEIKAMNWFNAASLMDKLMEIDNFSYYKNLTGFDGYFNFLTAKCTPDVSTFAIYLKNVTVRKAIHVGDVTFDSGSLVQKHLFSDVYKSVAPLISRLLSHYRILFYNGQLDVVVAYPLTENFLMNLKFSSAEEYKKAKRKIWKVGNTIAGYVKTAGNLTEILVRNAGHMVPHDQPRWALDMIQKFIEDKF